MKYPTPPPELILAKTIRTTDLLPWEFASFPCDLFYEVNAINAEYHAARDEARANLRPEDAP